MTEPSIRPHSSRHALASDPSRNVWVAASAGTGKTRALTDRITRMLLAGDPPETILAITFTRTGAAEMRRRILERARDWVRCDEPRLVAELAGLGLDDPEAAVAPARALLARLLEARGGLAIHTIHALAQAILAGFPLEAGLSPGTAALDERSARLLVEAALDDALAAAVRPGGRLLADAFQLLARETHEGEIRSNLNALAAAGPAYRAIGSTLDADRWLRSWLELPGEGPLDWLLADALAPPAFDEAPLRAWAAALAALGTEARQREAAALLAWLDLPPPGRLAERDLFYGAVLKADREPRSFAAPMAKSAALAAAHPPLLAQAQRLLDLERRLAWHPLATAWVRVGMEVAARYAARKEAAGAIDYDDMILLAGDLLVRDGMLGHVNQLLDRRIRHILVDEAQDTNSRQWRIIDALTDDFERGEGQHGARLRSRFAVGDDKQAIFGFQGTEPALFGRQRQAWERRAADACLPFDRVPLDRNFRSGPAILSATDAVLQALGTAAFGLDEDVRAHVPHRADSWSRVLWLPPWAPAGTAADAAGSDGDGDADADGCDPRYADALAERIAGWIGADHPDRLLLPARDGGRTPPRWAGPGDVLVLVRRRSDLMAGLVRALQQRGVPVAGVDRMQLTQPLAVRDCVSLMRAVLQPADELAMAEWLVSPLGGLDADHLWRLRRAGGGLADALSADPHPRAGRATALWRQAQRLADRAGPHAFLHGILAGGGRRLILERMGREAGDALDALLAEALAFEAAQPPTLSGFLSWLDASERIVQRDPDASPDRVRIMTVHGAKGLQAPVVVLADMLRGHGPRRALVEVPVGADGARLPIPAGAGTDRPARVAVVHDAAREADAAEDCRLLYVGMTRAEDVLVLAGERPARQPRGVVWHEACADALRALGATQVEVPGWSSEPALCLEEGAPPNAAAAAGPPAPVAAAVPAWAHAAVRDEPPSPRPLAPSAAIGDDGPQPPPSPARRDAAARGVLVHRLLERLPALPRAAREPAARRAMAAAGVAAADADPLWATVSAVLDHPDLAALFGPDALAEVPVAGVVDGRAIAGTVDRLLVEPDRVLVADFKTGDRVPAAAAAVHRGQLGQMAAYRALLRAALPGRRVEALLIYTVGPAIIALPDALLDGHWPPP